jgi:outer membrane autotransporter protein
LFGSVSNAGLISAAAFATAATAQATAAGIEFNSSSVMGYVSNTGLISGAAFATGIGGATAYAAGVDYEPGNVDSFALAVINNGLSGTISAYAAALGNGLDATATAEAIRVGHYTTSILQVSNAGLISGVAVSLLNAHITGSSVTATAKAHAAGIDAHGDYLSYGITNSGTIQAFADATLNFNFDGGYVDHATALARATGIELHAYEAGYSAASITNTGTIAALAVANIGTISGSSDITSGVSAVAEARGINIGGEYARAFIGNGTSGVISALAFAHGNGFDASADAAGVDLHGRSLLAGVVNAGQIWGVAVAGQQTNNGLGTTTSARAHASGVGVFLHGGTFFGGVANTGTLSSILGEGEAYGTIAAHAHGTGVAMSGRTFFGGVYNEGTIRGYAYAAGDSWAGAHARGVYLSGSVSTGGVANHGAIAGSASAIGNHAWAHGTGVEIHVRTFIGGVSNTGLISGLATASIGTVTYTGSSGPGNEFLASASANGVLIKGDVFQGAVPTFLTTPTVTSQVITNLSTPSLSASAITNSGLIIATATATGNLTIAATVDPSFTFEANAVGLNIDVHYLGSDIINSGSAANTQGIMAFANATPTVTMLSGSSNTVSASAVAAGLRLHTHTFAGSITNYGSIGAGALAAPTVGVSGGSGNYITAIAKARGVDISAHSVYGGIFNTGDIAAAALATPAVTVTGGSGTLFAKAEAYGVRAHSHYWGNGITNFGSIGAVAIASAVPTYGTAAGTWGATAIAKARGLDMVDYSTSSTISGGILNGTSAAISARAVAIAQANGGTQVENANAIGVKITTGTFNGSIVNNGGLYAYAQAGTTSNFNSTAFVSRGSLHNEGSLHPNDLIYAGTFAQAQGLVVNAGSFSGDIVNTGSIIAEAVAWQGSVAATGIALNVHTAWGTDGGLVTNSGKIWAFGKAAFSSSSTAAGIRIVSGSISPGTINNTGLIAGIGQSPESYWFTATAIDLSGAAAGPGTVINLYAGDDNKARIIGDTWLSSSNADTVNIYGSYVNGSIIGGGEGFNWYNTTAYEDPHSVNTVFASNGQTVNIFSGDHSGGVFTNASFFGFTPWAEGAVTAINPFDPFYYNWGGYTIANVETVNLYDGTVVFAPDSSVEGVGTLNIGTGVVSPLVVRNAVTSLPSSGATIVEYVTAPTDISHGTGTNGEAPHFNAGTINVSAGAKIVAFETPGYYAHTNLYGENFTYGTLNGSLGSIVTSYSPLFTAYLGPTPATNGDATLTLTRVAFGAVAGLDGKEQGFGNFLEQRYDALGPSASCSGGSFSQICEIEALSILNAAQYQRFMSMVDGEVNMQVWQPLIDVWDNFESVITNRLGSQGTGQFAGMPNLNGGIGKNSVSLASMMGNSLSDAGSPLGSGAQTPANGGPGGYGFWGRGYGIFSNGSNTSVMTGFSQNTGGVIGGFDMAATDNLVLGGAFDYAHGSMTLNDGSGKGSNDQYQIALYGRYDANPWYVNGVAGVGWGDYSQSRNVNGLIPFIGVNGQPLVLPVQGTASANYGATEFAAYGETGYTFNEGGYVLQPLVGLGYIHTQFDSFTETGAGMGDLTVGSASVNSLISTLGGRAQTTFTLDGGGKIIPSVMLGWQHQFLDTSMTLSESLASSPYAGFFQEKGPDYGRDSALLGVGIEGDIWDRTKLFLDYNVKLNGDYTAHAVSAGLRVDF